jgi:ABC-type phosphate/phosphonate transport system substrate-binding protein
VLRVYGIALIGMVAFSLAWVPANAQAPAQLRVGLLKGMFCDVPAPIIKAGARPFTELLEKQTSVKWSVDVVPDCEILATNMKNKQADIGVFHGFDFAWIREKFPEVQPLALTVPHSPVRACLIVHAESKAAKPDDLKGACVAYPFGTKAHCQLFLDRLKTTLPANCCGRAVHKPMSTPEVLDAIGSGQIEAAIVDSGSLNSYAKNQPADFMLLKTLQQSVVFPPAVIAYRKDALDDAALNNIRQGLTNSANVPSGRAFLMQWNLKGFEDVPAGFDGDMKRILNVYPAPEKKE